MNVKKPLAIAIFLLFLCVNVIPSTGITDVKQSIMTTFNDGSLSGYVNDTSMKPLAKALVRVHFHGTYEEDFTDSSGYYHVTNIPICNCTKNCTAFKEGYKPEWVCLSIHENTTYDFVLKPGNTLYVGGNGTGNYTKIQDAIDNASDGDTVFVYDDSSPYYENVIVDKSIILIGEDKNTTIIDGLKKCDVVEIISDMTLITDFTVTNSSLYPSCAGIRINSSYNSIVNCIILSNDYGIYLSEASNNTIANISSSNNDFFGIAIYYSSGNLVINCITKDGIALKHSSGNSIINCYCYKGASGNIGILIGYSENNRVEGCTITDTWKGVVIGQGSENNSITKCNISKNDIGINIFSSDNNEISKNNVLNNAVYGAFIECDSNKNTLHHNNFINNSINAYDECNNTWDNGYTSGGNYWDDYTGSDSDSDGIGDIPYNISGGSNLDLYPLMYPWYPTHPDTVYVDDDYTVLTPGFGYDCFNRIQYGINEVNEKGEIYVFNGTYFENVIVDKSIILIGEDKNTTVIDSGGGKNIICVKADYVTITGFTLQNNSMFNSGAIAIRFSDSTKIVGNNIKNNFCGVYLYWSNSNYISDNIISNNKGHGFYLVNSHDSNISKNYIIQNSRPMEFFESNRNIVIKNIISDNYGGGIGLWSSFYNIFLKNTFRNNAWNAAFQWADETIFFHRNIWLLNYWNRPRFFPKPIIGLRMIQNGEFFLQVPCVAFDWRPALKPYDIEV